MEMETILALVHTEADGQLSKMALEAVGAAVTLAGQLSGSALMVGICGENTQVAADQVAGCGAAKILCVAGADFAQARYASDAAAAEALCKAAGATIVIAPGSSRASRVMAGVAQRLGGRADTHVTAIEVEAGQPAIRRWYYRQRIEALQARAQRPWVLTLSPGCIEPYAGAPGTASAEPVAVALADAQRRTAVTGVQAPPEDQQTIRPDAKVLLVAGAGWTKAQADGQSHVPEAEKLILGFLAKTKASLGGSKSMVDLAGEGQATLTFMTHMNQIGQTGSTPRHAKGLSTCCHGEEPHVVGWRFINERRAVNINANCGWAQGKADVLYVADAFEVMNKVNELLG
jgi:electron transfer flavoprotein alpha subunit